MWMLQLTTGFDAVKGLARGSGINADRSLRDTFFAILPTLLRAVAILALVALLVGGAMYIFSFGNEDRAKTAKRVILYAIIGLLIMAISGLVVNFVIGLFR